jgi:hypothetical protein
VRVTRSAGARRARAGTVACSLVLATSLIADAADAVRRPAVAPEAPASARAARSAALFEQMLPVLQHPRCMNCHTSTGFPRQGDDRHRHIMNVLRGPVDRGAPGLDCTTCHQRANQPASGVPGAPDWHLAPITMAWEGLTPSELCRVLFDPGKGGLRREQLAAHLETPFVVWAWSPGVDSHGRARTTPPMSHQTFVALARRWVATGAVCP